MKKTAALFCGLFIFSPIITRGALKSQGFTDAYQEEYRPSPKGFAKERRILFELGFGVGGLSSLGPNAPIYTSAVVSLFAGATIPMYNKLTLDLRFRVGIPCNTMSGPLALSVPVVFQSSVTAGFYLGLGGLVFDRRVSGRGWLIFTGAGFTMDFGLRNLFSLSRAFSPSETLYQMFRLGGEANARFAYYFRPKLALAVHTFLGVSYSPFAGDPFYTNFTPLEVGFAQLSFGVGLGLLF